MNDSKDVWKTVLGYVIDLAKLILLWLGAGLQRCFMIKNPKERTSINVRISTDEKNQFQSMYPYMLSSFVKVAIVKALKDRSFFDFVLFGDKNK